jgi:hypothetical protein
MHLLRAIAVMIAAASVAAAPAATPLAIKPGLWEVTVQGSIAGLSMLPSVASHILKPHQREQLADAIGNVTGPHTFKECVSQHELANGLNWANGQGRHCTHTVSESTGQSMTAEIDCQRHHGGTRATVHFDVASPEEVNGTVDVTVLIHKQSIAMSGSIEGHWLGDDCHGVAPGELH